MGTAVLYSGYLPAVEHQQKDVVKIQGQWIEVSHESA